MQKRLKEELAQYIGFAKVDHNGREARFIVTGRRMNKTYGCAKSRLNEYNPEIVIQQFEIDEFNLLAEFDDEEKIENQFQI